MAADYAEAQDDPTLAAGQRQGMIEHATLLRGLILGDEAAPLRTQNVIAKEAVRTWRARWAKT